MTIIGHVGSVVIRHHKVKTTEPNDAIRVYYKSPCNTLPELVKERKPSYATAYMQRAYGIKYSNYVSYVCENHYTQEWLAAVDELAACRHDRIHRSKRGVLSTVQTINAATNLLRSFFTKGDPTESIDKVNRYNITTQITLNIMRDIHQTTNMTHVQTDNSRVKTMEHMPMHIYGEYIVHKSIAIKSYLLRRIAKECRETGNLAIEPMSELIEDKEIQQYDQKQTNITGVQVNNESNYFEIDSEASLIIDQIEEIETEEVMDVIKPMMIDRLTTIVVLFGAMIGLIIVTVCAFFYFVRRCQGNAANNQNIWGHRELENRTR